MFSFLTRDKEKKVADDDKAGAKARESKEGVLASFKKGLSKTRKQFTSGIADIFLGRKSINEDLWKELSTLLLQADLGQETTSKVLENINKKVGREDINNSEEVIRLLKEELLRIACKVEAPLSIPDSDKPFVILVVGVNGAGKTTSIGKITYNLLQDENKVQLAAGDTFRAGAIAQLGVWGDKLNVPVTKQQPGADSASVLYDALASATAKKMDVLIADTAGRLHTQQHLMAELSKIIRVIKKLDATAPHEILLVLDGSIGQNSLKQTETFLSDLGLTGLVITKLDGTAKGGIVFSIADKLNIPIRYIGVGEDASDLKPFNAVDFVNALFD